MLRIICRVRCSKREANYIALRLQDRLGLPYAPGRGRDYTGAWAFYA
jgi:hypothetical protein